MYDPVLCISMDASSVLNYVTLSKARQLYSSGRRVAIRQVNQTICSTLTVLHLCGNAPGGMPLYYFTILCLTPDNFTHPWESFVMYSVG